MLIKQAIGGAILAFLWAFSSLRFLGVIMRAISYRFPFSSCRIAAAVAACFAPFAVSANPLGAIVVAGTANVVQQGQVLTVTNSPGAIIDWQGFSIGPGETTRFIQSSSASRVLNRVVTGDPSLIQGSLISNGQVFLINPAGVVVGAGGRVDTAAFVASTLNLSNGDFLAGRMHFQGGGQGPGVVENLGEIRTPSGGYVYLLGSEVLNQGLIDSPQGEVFLAAGQSVQLLETSLPGVRAEIVAEDQRARNVGRIMAESGRVGLNAALVEQSGVVSASSALYEGGRVVLRATREAKVAQDAVIDVRGEKGGEVDVFAPQVLV